MAIVNLGNVVGSLARTTPPNTKKYIWWFHILDINYPDEGILKKYDATLGEWIPAMDLYWLGAINGFQTNTPPVGPVAGDTYIIGTSPTGIWSGKNNQHAIWLGHSWFYITPKAGSRASSKSGGTTTYHFNGSIWASAAFGGLATAANGLSTSGSVVKFGGTPLTEVVQLNLNTAGGGYLQFIDGSDIIADFPTRRLYHDTGEKSIDWDSGELLNLGGDARLDWLSGYMYDSFGSYSILWFDHQLHAVNGLSVDYNTRELIAIDSFFAAPSIDWQQRYAYASNGERTIHWNTCELRDVTGSNISVDWGARVLYMSDGTASVRWADHTLVNSVSDTTLNWQLGYLIAENGSQNSVEWLNRYLITSGGAYVVDWENGVMTDDLDINAFHWFSRIIYDTDGVVSVDANQRTLTSETGLAAIRFTDNPFISGIWGLGNSADVAGELSVFGRVFMQSWKTNYVENHVNDTVDYTPHITISSAQQSNHDNPNGDAIRIIEEHGAAKAGIKWYSAGKPAQVISTNAQPFAVTTGQTLILQISGGASVTVTFNPAISGAATAAEICDAITKAVNYTSYPTGLVSTTYWGQAIEHVAQSGSNRPGDPIYVAIRSAFLGVGGSVNITGGTARVALGFSTGSVTGTVGTTTISASGSSTRPVEQMAWLIAHHFPNNPASSNEHYHFSIEIPDASGEMQTRVSWEMYRDVCRMLISSAMLILDTYPLTVAASANSNKSIFFSRDNTGRDIARVWELQTEADSSGGNLRVRGYDAAGAATNLMVFERLNKYIFVDGAIQEKIRPSTNSSAGTLTLTPQNGNTFVLSGTTQISYMANTTWQAGTVIRLILQGAAGFVHAAGSPTSTNRPFKLMRSQNYVASSVGSIHEFIYDGTTYGNQWVEISRNDFSDTRVIYGDGVTIGSWREIVISNIMYRQLLEASGWVTKQAWNE